MNKKTSTPEEISFETRIDTLFKELDLAIRWNRPAIFLVVYSSAFIAAKAIAALENRLIKIGQEIAHLTPEPGHKLDVISTVKNWERESTVFFAMNMECNGDGASNYEIINSNNKFLVDNPMRIVYWLTEEDFLELAKEASPSWSFRHRMIEFTDSLRQDHVLSYLIEKTWQHIDDISDVDGKPYSDMYKDALKKIGLQQDNPAPLETARLLITLGMLHWRHRNLLKANEFVEMALEIAETEKNEQLLAESYIAFALIKTELQQIEEAVHAYEKVTRLPPCLRMPWNNLGNLYTKLFMFDKALNAYQKALELNGNDPISWQGLGTCHLKLNQNEKAIEAFKCAIHAEPTFAHPWKGLAQAYAASGQLQDAIEAFKNSLEIDHRQVDAWLEKARLEEWCNQLQNAQEDYKRILELDDARAEIWNLIGNIHYKSGEYSNAIKAYFQAIQRDGNYGWAYCNMALAYSQKRKFAEAIVLYQKSILTFVNRSDIANALVKMGYLYQNQENHIQAIKAFLQAEQLDKSSIIFSRAHILPGPFDQLPIHISTDNVRESKGVKSCVKFPTSLTDLESAEGKLIHEPESRSHNQDVSNANSDQTCEVSNTIGIEQCNSSQSATCSVHKKSQNAKYWIDLGNFYLGTGMFESAIEAYQNALELDPRNGDILGNIATAHTFIGEYQEAIPLFEKSIEFLDKNQDKAAIWNKLGNVYRRLNNRRQATFAYQRAKELGNDRPSIKTRARSLLLSNCLFE